MYEIYMETYIKPENYRNKMLGRLFVCSADVEIEYLRILIV